MGIHRYVKPSAAEDNKLREVEQGQQLNLRVRLRAQEIRLSNHEWSIAEIAEHVGRGYVSVKRDADRWESKGVEGLADGSEPGKPRSLSADLLDYSRELLAEDRDRNARHV